ncbi:MAG: isoprenylcysteine carboxylmethyltransferase family protein [Candidatus Korobacteraceae bacterium]
MTENETQSAARARLALSWSRIARRIRVPLGFAFAAFYLWRARPTWLSLVVGAAIAALGLGIRAVASGHVDKNEELATTGPYAYVRNPLYLGSIVIAIGFAVAARDVAVAVLIVLMFAVIYVPTIRSEERFLRTRFAEYSAYAHAVPRLIPSTLRSRALTRNFSRALYLKHHEYNASFGALAMLLALLVKMLWSRG